LKSLTGQNGLKSVVTVASCNGLAFKWGEREADASVFVVVFVGWQHSSDFLGCLLACQEVEIAALDDEKSEDLWRELVDDPQTGRSLVGSEIEKPVTSTEIEELVLE